MKLSSRKKRHTKPWLWQLYIYTWRPRDCL